MARGGGCGGGRRDGRGGGGGGGYFSITYNIDGMNRNKIHDYQGYFINVLQ